jgi:3'(2'), 5'-bisphosphate nucleotidase
MSALQKELSTAITAVVRASRLTQKIFKSLQSGQKSSAGTVTKVDKSPVTIADYGSQAIVNAVLRSVFPADPIVGEEDSNELRANQELRQKVWDLVSSTLQATPAKEIAQGGGEIRSDEEMLDLIDSGNYAGGSNGRTSCGCTKLMLRFLDARSN